MTDEPSEPASQLALLTSLTMMLSEYESHPANKGELELRLTFRDDAGLQYVWKDGRFDVDHPGKDN